MEYQKDFYAHESGADFPAGTTKKAVSGMGNTTKAGTFTPEIKFDELYGASTPAVDTQFIHSVIPTSAGLPDAAPKNGNGKSKGKKGY